MQAQLESPPRIEVRDLERVFDDGKRVVHALGPLSIDVREGEFFCVVGPSGCGKSTLLRVIAGLVNPSAGEVVIQHDDADRPLVGMVFQDNSIYPWKTVEKNVRFDLDIRGKLPRAERKRIAHDYLRLLGLTDSANAYPATLSGGMRQRVAIGRALASGPEVLLMDEPFAALDAQMRTLMQDSLVELWERDRRTVVFITHSIEEAIFLGDRVAVMSARPGVIRVSRDIPFERPRSHALRGRPEFGALQEELWEIVRDEVNKQIAGVDAVAPID